VYADRPRGTRAWHHDISRKAVSSGPTRNNAPATAWPCRTAKTSLKTRHAGPLDNRIDIASHWDGGTLNREGSVPRPRELAPKTNTSVRLRAEVGLRGPGPSEAPASGEPAIVRLSVVSVD